MYNEVISLNQIVRFFKRNLLMLLSITGLFAIFSVVWVTSLEDQFTAEVSLTPNDSQGENMLSGLSSQLGGLAGLAGMNIGSGATNSADVALETLSSRNFIQAYITKNNLLPFLLAGKSWSPESKAIVYDSSVFDYENSTWVRVPPKGKDVIPSAWEGYDSFMNMLNVESTPQSGIVKISFESISPEVSLMVVNSLVTELNLLMRRTAIEESKRSIEYLENQIAGTSVAEVRAALSRLIEEQTKTLMLAQVREDYSFKVVAAPVYPEDKSNPKRAFLCIIITFLGGVLGVLVALVREAIKADS